MRDLGEIKRALLGTLEISLLMRQGVERFPGDVAGMMRSFWVPMILFPVSCLMLWFIPPGEPPLTDISFGTVIALYAGRMVVVLALTFFLFRTLLRAFHREDHLCRIVSAINWLNVPGLIVLVPFVWMVAAGAHSWKEVEPMVIVLSLYSYVCIGFLVRYEAKMPWELAGFAAIAYQALDQTSLEALNWVAEALV